MFRLTYSTMFDPPEALHAHFEAALDAVRGTLGAEHPMWIGGEDVRAAFAGHEYAFTPTRPGHWLLDLYAVARRKLEGLKEVSGGGFCTFSEADRFFSYRRDRRREGARAGHEPARPDARDHPAALPAGRAGQVHRDLPAAAAALPRAAR